MDIGQIVDGSISLVIGVFMLLVGFGKLRVLKDPLAQDKFLKHWGLFFKISGPIVILVGIAIALGR